MTSEFLRDWDQTKVLKQSAIPSILFNSKPIRDSKRFARCDVQVLPRSSEGGRGSSFNMFNNCKAQKEFDPLCNVA